MAAMEIDEVDVSKEAAKAFTGAWWVPLVIGVLFLVFALLLLTVDPPTTAVALGIWAGIGFAFASVAQFVTAGVVSEWKWIHVAFGVFAALAAIVAFVWPGKTIVVVASIVAWFVLFSGVFEIVFSFFEREENEAWWLRLIAGVLMVVIGFWAAGYENRSFALLVVWIAAWAVISGISSIVIAFKLRAIHRQLV